MSLTLIHYQLSFKEKKKSYWYGVFKYNLNDFLWNIFPKHKNFCKNKIKKNLNLLNIEFEAVLHQSKAKNGTKLFFFSIQTKNNFFSLPCYTLLPDKLCKF